MKGNRSAILFIILSICLWRPLAAQMQPKVKDTASKFEQKIESLERQLNELRKLYDEHKKLLAGEVNNKSKELENKFNEISVKMQNDYGYLKTLIWIFGPLTVLSTILLIIKLVKETKKIAIEKLKEKLDAFFEEKKNDFDRIVKEHRRVFLGQKKKILVISPNQNDSEDLARFLKDKEFREVDFTTPEDLSKLNKVDLVLFNDENGQFPHEKITEIANQTQDNVFCFYFTKMSNRRYGNNKIADRLNFANSKVQLYGNLINSLRYHSTL